MAASVPQSAYDSATFDRNAVIRLPEIASSASISPSARDVVLASRSGLRILDLDNPEAEPRFLAFHVPSGTTDVQWSPHSFQDSWIVSTAGSHATLWDVAHGSQSSPILAELKGHGRSITDLNFSAHHHEILATCSIDSFVFLWDLRAPTHPTLRLADWHESASQVKFNRQDEHIIATAHGGHFNIWDDRKGAVPLKVVNAHTTKIYGIDWHREYKENILTCSLDRSIKLWNWGRANDSPEESAHLAIDRVIHTGYPVWRARYVPFGHAILAMPHRADNRLHLYDSRTYRLADRNAAIQPTHSFTGHLGPVREFLWRHRGGVEDGRDMRDFQLVSSSMDRTLRLHTLTTNVLSMVGYHKGNSFESSLRFTRKDATYQSFSDSSRPIDDFTPLKSSSLTAPLSKRSYAHYPVLVEARSSAISGHRRETDAHSISGSRHESLVSQAEDSLASHSFPESSVDGHVSQLAPRSRLGIARRPPSDQNDFAQTGRFDGTVEALEGVAASPADVAGRSFETSTDSAASKPWDEDEYALETVAESEDDATDAVDLLDDEEDDDDDAVIGAFISTSAAQRITRDDKVPSNRKRNVPPPRTCTARWGANGALVCLFPQKKGPEEVYPPAKVPDFRGIAELFTSTVQQQADNSDADSFSSRSSSADALLSGHNGVAYASSMQFEHSHFTRQRPMLRRTSEDQIMSTLSESRNGASIEETESVGFRRASENAASGSFSRSTPPNSLPIASMSSRSFQATRRPRNSRKPSSYMVTYKLPKLLPSKKYLAEEYLLTGDPWEICSHNAAVCRRHRLKEHARAWEDAALIVQRTVPLRMAPGAYQLPGACEYFPARRTIVQIARRDSAGRHSGFDLAYDDPTEVVNPVKRASVPWRSGHPLGARTVDKMVKKFEAQGDEQMLAMLACVFGEQLRGQTRAAERVSAKTTQGARQVEDQRAQAARRRKLTSRNTGTVALHWKNDERFEKDPDRADESLIGFSDMTQCCAWRERYGEILYSWGLYEARAQMLKANGHVAMGGGDMDTLVDYQPGPGVCEDCSVCDSRIEGDAKYCGSGSHGMHEGCVELLRQHHARFGSGYECPFGCDGEEVYE